jgi:hypothetical protein
MNKLSFFILAVWVFGCQTGTGLIQEKKEHDSSQQTLSSSDVKVEWTIRNSIEMAEAPLDVEISANGKWTFVLTRQGNIFVYSADGELKDVMVVGGHVDGIKVDPLRQDMIAITSERDKTVEFLELSFIRDIDVSNSPFKGTLDAPVVIVVFSDFLKLSCAKLLPLFKQVLELYPEQVKLVYKSYPDADYKVSVKAAIATFAADRQGKFWEFHDLLFSRFESLNEQTIDDVALEIGLDTKQFKKDLKDPRIMESVRSDFLEGSNNGVEEAPAVFVNGTYLRDATIQALQVQIARALAKTKE